MANRSTKKNLNRITPLLLGEELEKFLRRPRLFVFLGLDFRDMEIYGSTWISPRKRFWAGFRKKMHS